MKTKEEKPFRLIIIDPIDHERLKRFFEMSHLDCIKVVYANTAIPFKDRYSLPFADAVLFGIHIPFNGTGLERARAIELTIKLMRSLPFTPWAECPVIVRNAGWAEFQHHAANRFGKKKLFEFGVIPGEPMELLRTINYLSGNRIPEEHLRVIRGTLHLRPSV